jgi:hypothetical protein
VTEIRIRTSQAIYSLYLSLLISPQLNKESISMTHTFLKQFLVFTALSMGLNFNQALAQSQPMPVSEEVSALLMSPQFSKTITQLRRDTPGQLIRIKSISNVDLGSHGNFAQVHLVSKTAGDFQAKWRPMGEVIGVVFYGPMGAVFVESVYFKPGAIHPGGATVSN